MKILFSLFAIVMLTESCNSTKEAVSDSKENVAEETVAIKPNGEVPISKSDIVKDSYNKTFITYKALSRGTFEYIQISKSKVTVSSDRNLKAMDSYTCKDEDWKALSSMMEKLDMESFQKLKAPTEKRLFDGAAHATLSIIRGDVEIMTPSFDHGAPPKEIEALVNKVLSIKENVSKQ